MVVRDRSLITGRGRARKWERGTCQVLPLQKKEGGGGKETVLALLKGGGDGTTSFEVVLTHELDALAILKAGTKSFHPIKRGWVQTVLPISRGVGQKVLDPRFPHFVAPPPSCTIPLLHKENHCGNHLKE